MTTITLARRAGWFGQAAQVLHRWLLSTFRQVWAPVMALVQPVIWIVLFGQVFRSLGMLPQFGDAGYVTYLVPGILMMTVLYSGSWAGSGYIDDIKSGVMEQYLTSPIARSAIVAGQLAEQLVIGIAQSAVVLAVGFAAGARYPGGFGGIVVGVLVASVLAVIFCCSSTALALTTRSQIAFISLSQLVVLPVTFLSTTMMPTSLMPLWVSNVSRWNPMTWAVDLGRGGLHGIYPAHGWWFAAGLVVLAVLSFVWAVRSLRSYQRSI